LSLKSAFSVPKIAKNAKANMNANTAQRTHFCTRAFAIEIARRIYSSSQATELALLFAMRPCSLIKRRNYVREPAISGFSKVWKKGPVLNAPKTASNAKTKQLAKCAAKNIIFSKDNALFLAPQIQPLLITLA